MGKTFPNSMSFYVKDDPNQGVSWDVLENTNSAAMPFKKYYWSSDELSAAWFIIFLLLSGTVGFLLVEGTAISSFWDSKLYFLFIKDDLIVKVEIWKAY